MIARLTTFDYFNPLPRKEGDAGRASGGFWQSIISIHSLVKRETEIKLSAFGSKSISIHSLVKRETYLIEPPEFTAEISIHSLVKRETARNLTFSETVRFQSTPS